MNAIDRVMIAYLKTRSLTAEQATRVRTELSEFIDALSQGKTATSKPTASSNPGTK